jgi:hypothetical protein
VDNWLRSGKVDIRQLIGWLAGRWDRPHHARILCDVTRQYLTRMSGHYDLREVVAVLQQNGYLAQALHQRHPQLPQYQVDVLVELLLVTTGGHKPDRNAIADFMLGTKTPPTPELLVAVLTLVDPADASYTRDLYITGQLSFMGLGPETQATLNWLMPTGGPPSTRPTMGHPSSPSAQLERTPGPPFHPLQGLSDASRPKRRWYTPFVPFHERRPSAHDK